MKIIITDVRRIPKAGVLANWEMEGTATLNDGSLFSWEIHLKGVDATGQHRVTLTRFRDENALQPTGTELVQLDQMTKYVIRVAHLLTVKIEDSIEEIVDSGKRYQIEMP